MQQEILALFGVCIALGMCELLLPGEENNSSRRLLRFFVSLVVLLLILTPFVRFLQKSDTLFSDEVMFEEGDPERYEQIFSQTVQAQGAKDLEAGIHALLEKEYGIAATDCTVLVYFEADGALARVSIFLSGKALTNDPERIRESLSKRLNCTVEVR